MVKDKYYEKYLEYAREITVHDKYSLAKKYQEINHYLGQRAHYFDDDTMRFFKSRILSYFGHKDNKDYFISSEDDGERGRRYTVNYLDNETGSIETVGEFYKLNRKQAMKLFMDSVKS